MTNAQCGKEYTQMAIAAPELLEALKWAAITLEAITSCVERGDSPQFGIGHFQKMRHVNMIIAKALGRE